jgi:hypothetical protein
MRLKYIRSLIDVFACTAGSFVIGLILVPCAMSSPIKSQYSQHQQDHGDDDGEQQQQEMLMLTDPPFWHNPCGMQITYEGSGSGVGHDMMMMESDSAMRREEDIIDGIVLSAKQALSQAEQFAGSFVSTSLLLFYTQLLFNFHPLHLDLCHLQRWFERFIEAVQT